MRRYELDTAPALVTACYGRRGRMETATGEELPYLAASRRHKPVCGDEVRFELRDDDSPALLRDILPRRNELSRTGARERTEVVAANFSLLAIVAAPEPAPDYELVDRLLCAAAGAGAEGLIVWNKTDLGRGRPERLREYEAAGFEIVTVSALKGARIRRLRRRLKAHTSVFAGQSGGGKSTLVNALLGREAAAAGELSVKARRGRHTTASAVMYSLPGGGRVMDLPGVRSLMPVLTDYGELQAGFPEFSDPAQECRFANCRHRNEPGCSVLEAVAAGRLPAGRHAGYLALLREFEELAATV
ncbi:MAG: ribosome small subunit-dependent GTPase A [Gammaproteobacteria bacterium]|nr:ribosome small subunit-dependent GTPase A [Gammaproteobacteria bacterium]MXW44990.1 ribosome small subunit-dependent GTPase A [Gammaproteobacteria bacterium]MYD02528.1 ribosome small subunit-dependent GTPase A [Gammaproteobacteria bacterium]MYI25357.1 ribosome small subunit-dependent GTPase A [Gammaproteobacteria bacterium]